MHTVVVTAPGGELIADVDVSPDELVGFVASFAVLVNTHIFVDGKRLTPEQRARLLREVIAEAQAAALAAPTMPAPASTTPHSPMTPPPSPHDVGGWMDLYRRGFEDLHLGYQEVRRAAAQSYQEMHEYMKSAAEMHIAMQRDLADEAVRQRRLTAQSLGDIDLMHRAVKTAELNEAFAQMKAVGSLRPGASPKALAQRGDDRATWGDVYQGLLRVFTKE